jgi:hypothetical protein
MEAIPQEIQDQFSQSWATTQASFAALIDQPQYDDIIPLYIFIQQFKKSGDYQNFRSGISRQDLVISRSAEPALRPDQKFIRIKVNGSSFVITLKDSKKMYKEYTLKDLDDERFTELLQTLKDMPVD